MATLNPDVDWDTIHLGRGRHNDREHGTCLLEAVAWIAGEDHSDHPECVSPVLAAFGRTWNDNLDDDDRQRLLKPIGPRLVGTRASAEVEDRRAWLALDWLVRVYTPAWLALAGLDEHAAALRAASPVVDAESLEAVMGVLSEGLDAAVAAWDAAWEAARAAAGDAAWDALRSTVVDLQTSALDLYERMIEAA